MGGNFVEEMISCKGTVAKYIFEREGVVPPAEEAEVQDASASAQSDDEEDTVSESAVSSDTSSASGSTEDEVASVSHASAPPASAAVPSVAKKGPLGQSSKVKEVKPVKFAKCGV